MSLNFFTKTIDILSEVPNNVFLNNDHYSLKIHAPFTALFVGSSKSGKSTLLRNLLQSNNIQPFPEKILYIYGEYDAVNFIALSEIFKERISFKKENLIDFSVLTTVLKNCLVVFDDMLSRIFDEITIQKLFVQGSHHRGISVIIISQNIYPKGKFSRTISLNCNYFFIFDIPRDRSSVKYLSRQAFPQKPDFLYNCYNDIVINKDKENTYRYIVVDFSISSPERFRIWSNITHNMKAFVCLSMIDYI